LTGQPRSRRNSTPRHTAGFRPSLETLEGRIVPTFSAPVGILSSQTVALIARDINGDGHPDLISADNNGNQIAVRLNNGNGAFGAPAIYSGQWQVFGPATALAVGAYKGQPSIFEARYAAGNGTGGISTVSVLQLKSNGLLSDVGDRPLTPGAAGPISSLAVADLYGDGETDLVAAPATGGHVYVERINSVGSFGAPISYQIAATSLSLARIQLAVGDLNGDGRPDLVVNNPIQSSVSVLLNNGGGTLGWAQNYVVGGRPGAVAVGDVNGDGKPDVVAANSNGTVSVLAGLGNGAFGPVLNYAIGGPANSVALGDFNHDGRLDIVTTGGTEMDVLVSNANGTFAAYQNVGPAGSSVVTADFNGDGYADLAEIFSVYGIDVLLNDAKW
jgi:hypothetical protein